MPTLRHLEDHVRQYGLKHKPLYAFSLVIFFFCVFDGILTYVTPLLLVQNGFSEATMGLIIGSSSVAGALFDFFICRIFRKSDYRLIFMILFVICTIYPLILFKAQSAWIFLLAMGLWGIYYDLFNFGRFNFAGLNLKSSEHASGSGVLQVFRALGYLVAPLLAGMVVVETVNLQAFEFSWIFLGFGFLFFLLLLYMVRKQHPKTPEQELCCRTVNLQKEFYLWAAASNLLRPVLIVTVLLCVFDSFFWTIGPLYAQSLHGVGGLSGLLLMAYEVPILGVGWCIGAITHKRGKKRTAFYSLGIGSALLLPLAFVTNPVLIIGLVFCAAFFISIATPSVNGAFTDYIAEAPTAEKEIVGINDFATNIGFVIGPIAAGLLAENLGNGAAFAVLALVSIGIVLILLKTTPRHIGMSSLELAAETA
ncbi:MAG: MFS transporter [bacterium]